MHSFCVKLCKCQRRCFLLLVNNADIRHSYSRQSIEDGDIKPQYDEYAETLQLISNPIPRPALSAQPSWGSFRRYSLSHNESLVFQARHWWFSEIIEIIIHRYCCPKNRPSLLNRQWVKSRQSEQAVSTEVAE